MLGCPTVSAAVGLLLLSLDPLGDPTHMLLCLDFYLLASGNHARIQDMMNHDYGAGATIANCELEHANEGRAYVVGKVGVQLIGIDPADVIGLDDLLKIAHGGRLSVRSTSLER